MPRAKAEARAHLIVSTRPAYAAAGWIRARLEFVGNAASRVVCELPVPALLAVAAIAGLAVRVAVLRLAPVSVHETHYLHDAQRVLERGGAALALRGSVHGWLAALGYARILSIWPNAGEVELRWVQLAFSLASLALVFAVGRAAASPRVGAAAALVHALTPSTVSYGASAEPYAAHLLLVGLLTVAYVWTVRNASIGRVAALAALCALAVCHHLVAAVNALTLAGHALADRRASARSRVARVLALAAGVAVALPMALGGNPGHALHLLGASIPYFFSVAVVGSIVVFAVLWDETAADLDPAWAAVLPWAFVAPVLFWLPYGRLQYLLPGSLPMAVVLGAALARRRRPAMIGAVLLFVALNLLSDLTAWSSGAPIEG